LSTNSGTRALRVGVAGLGMAGGGILEALARSPEVAITASADPRPAAQALFRERFGGQAYASLEALCHDDSVEAIWIATPTQLHAEHVRIATSLGKHVAVEKPLAVTLAECESMIDAAGRNGVSLIAAGARSFDPAFVAMREIVNEVRELKSAIDDGLPPLHDGRWGMATMEVVLALVASSSERREIKLRHQVAVR
jgi:phthalate 4,5-cis-dihydrodiol dehydrogenase